MQGRSGSLAGAPTTAEQASNGLVENRPLLLTRDFGLVWSGQLISQIGDGVSKLALLWFVYAVTGSFSLTDSFSCAGSFSLADSFS